MNDEQSHYCVNLIEVNKKQSVVISQPIYNEQGILLLAEGADLNEKRAQIILQHKLMKPLEQCVGIASSLDAKKLFVFLNKFAFNIPGLYAVTNNDHYQKSLRVTCLFYDKFPLLQQNLTVLALRAPEMYFQGLFSAMAGLAIAIKLNLNISQQQTIFIAGLFHDVGFLYLAPDLREKTQSFTSNEWKALQAHPLIAQRFLNLVPELPKDIGQVIASHHERIDGTGYPHHIFGDDLSMPSQIIAATDNIISNHSRYKNYGVHAHNMLLAALKLSDNIYIESVYDAAMVLFKHAAPPTEIIIELPLAEELLIRQKKIRLQFEHIKFLSKQLMTYSKNPIMRSVNTVMGRLGIAVIRSGILQPEQEDWLIQYNKENTHSDGSALVETSVMQDQILDQLVHLKNLMERVIESIPPTESTFKNLAESTFNKIDLYNI